MVKFASDLVPLREQLAQSLALHRFHDPDWDLYSDNIVNSRPIPAIVYDEIRWSQRGGTVAPSALDIESPGRAPLDGPPTLNSPTTNDDGGTIPTQGHWYRIVALDASNRFGPWTDVFVQMPLGVTDGAVSLSWDAVPNAAKYRVYKFRPDYNHYWWYYQETTSQLSITDTYSNNENWYSVTGWTVQQSNSTEQKAFPNVDSDVIDAPVVTALVTGGGNKNYNFNTRFYAVSALNDYGETLVSAAVEALNPVSYRVADDAMGNITLQSIEGGTIPVGDYFYRVVPYTTYGEAHASPEAQVTVGEGATPQPGSVQINWTPVEGADGYRIYRGTTAGDVRYMVSVAGQATQQFVDDGSYVPANVRPGYTNGSGFKDAGSIDLSWGAVAGATNYRVWGPDNATDTSYWNVGPDTTSWTDDGSAIHGTRTRPVYNGTDLRFRVISRGIRFSRDCVISKVGFWLNIPPESDGERYRAVISRRNSNSSTWYGPYKYLKAGIQYVEWEVDQNYLYPDSYGVSVAVEGVNGNALIRPLHDASVTGPAEAPVQDYGTYVGHSVVSFGTGYSDMTLVGPEVIHNPIMIERRVAVPRDEAIPSSEVLVGSVRNATRYFLGRRWSFASAPHALAVYPYPNPSDMPSGVRDLFGVAVSVADSDSNAAQNFTELNPSGRTEYDAPSKNLMFRFALPGAFAFWRPMGGEGRAPGPDAYHGDSRDYFIANSGHRIEYWSYTSSSDAYYPSTGGVYPSHSPNQNRNFWGIHANGILDADVTVDGNPEDGNGAASTAYYFGPFVRASNEDNGIYLKFDGMGNLTLQRVENNTYTDIETVATGLTGRRKVRLVAVGDRFLGFVDGALFLDVVDENTIQGEYHGFKGKRGRVWSLEVSDPGAENRQTPAFEPWQYDHVVVVPEM